MARIELSGLITSLKGSIGGTTFQYSKYGYIARNKPFPKYFQPLVAGANMQACTLFVNRWHSLSFENQSDWQNFADTYIFINRFGRSYYVSGFNAFFSVNYYRFKCGLSITATPAATTAPLALPVVTYTMDNISMEFSLASTLNDTNNYLFLFTTPPIQLLNYPINGLYKLTSIIQCNSLSGYNFTSDWEDTHALDYSSIYGAGLFRVASYIISVCSTSGRKTAGSYSNTVLT